MTKTAYIISAEKNGPIKAVLCSPEDCTSCTGGCESKHTVVEVTNPMNFDVKTGSSVTVGASSKIQFIQGIISLIFPFLSAVGGYFAAKPLAGFFGKTVTNDERAIFVLLFLFISSTLVFTVTRKFPIPGKPRILMVNV